MTPSPEPKPWGCVRSSASAITSDSATSRPTTDEAVFDDLPTRTQGAASDDPQLYVGAGDRRIQAECLDRLGVWV